MLRNPSTFRFTERCLMANQERSVAKERFARRSFLALVAAGTLGAVARAAVAAEPLIKVHKDPNCGCCSGWVQHLRRAGFTVQVDDASDLPKVRRRASNGMSRAM